MSDAKEKPVRATSPGRERRAAPRFRFTARAEVTDHSSDTVLAGRIVKISQNGCYVNTLSAPPPGTRIRLRITHGLDTFKSAGEVKHVESGAGMGVQFIDTPEDQQRILDGWLAQMSTPD